MHESGLWSDEMIPQAQGVVYLHGTKENPVYEHGGRFIYYPNGPGWIIFVFSYFNDN